jgi:5-deoxy-glucuronate isomerase
MSERFSPAGTLRTDSYSVSIAPSHTMLTYPGLQILELAPGESHGYDTGSTEVAVLPLTGSCRVAVDDHRFDLAGRESVFEEVTDFVYVPVDSSVEVTSPAGGVFALCTAEATRRIDPYYVAAEDVPVEVRGGGSASRQINNFLSAEAHDADAMIAVEVLTPGGDWSSYPPHKHDEFSNDEVALEEIYYFRIDGDGGIGVFSCYSPDRTLDDTVTVRDGDVYLVPDGYHGPAAAAPGHDMYYLNVMAGPGAERVWRFCDDPVHAWTRNAFEQLPADPRLPMATAPGTTS